jgi:hypothetical protein
VYGVICRVRWTRSVAARDSADCASRVAVPMSETPPWPTQVSHLGDSYRVGWCVNSSDLNEDRPGRDDIYAGVRTYTRDTPEGEWVQREKVKSNRIHRYF